MKRYALLQDGDGQIRVIDNSTHIGKKQVEKLCMEGYKGVGYLESEQPISRLMRGFNKNSRDKLDESDKKLWGIRKILDE